jgi:tetratricopeptide (TPR) repeat protein
MSLVQFILLLLTLLIFYLFFTEIFQEKEEEESIKTLQKDLNSKLHQIKEKAKLIISLDSFLEKKDYKKAKERLFFTKLKDYLKTDYQLLRRAGMIFLELGEYERAEEYLRKALKINPNDDLSHNLLANTLHKLGKSDDAIKHHQAAIALDKNYSPFYFNYANTLYEIGDYKNAQALYEKAYRFDNSLKVAKEMMHKIDKILQEKQEK